jgi:hypothetical protein
VPCALRMYPRRAYLVSDDRNLCHHDAEFLSGVM